MGTDVEAGEQRQLIVGGGVWKMSQLSQIDMDSVAQGTAEDQDRIGCLITEVVTPGFHWEDHAFLTMDGLESIFNGVAGGQQRITEFQSYLKKLTLERLMRISYIHPFTNRQFAIEPARLHEQRIQRNINLLVFTQARQFNT